MLTKAQCVLYVAGVLNRMRCPSRYWRSETRDDEIQDLLFDEERYASKIKIQEKHLQELNEWIQELESRHQPVEKFAEYGDVAEHVWRASEERLNDMITKEKRELTKREKSLEDLKKNALSPKELFFCNQLAAQEDIKQEISAFLKPCKY